MSSQTILVTGAAGFVGSRLAKVLLARGDRVIGLDNLNDYYPLVHKQRHLVDLMPDPRFTFVQKDLCDAEGLLQIMREYRPQAVAHLAAMAAVRYSVKHPLIYGHVNVQGSMNLMDAARQVGGARLVLASTGSSYGSNTPVPFVETAPCDRPLAPYPASKRAMELMAHSFNHLYGIPVTILRFFNVYGPHGRPDMMPWQWTRMIQRGDTLNLVDGHRADANQLRNGDAKLANRWRAQLAHLFSGAFLRRAWHAQCFRLGHLRHRRRARHAGPGTDSRGLRAGRYQP